eukprot:scaffold17437_cov173-Amphora_coffeaeformis.AAC.9
MAFTTNIVDCRNFEDKATNPFVNVDTKPPESWCIVSHSFGQQGQIHVRKVKRTHLADNFFLFINVSIVKVPRVRFDLAIDWCYGTFPTIESLVQAEYTAYSTFIRCSRVSST